MTKIFNFLSTDLNITTSDLEELLGFDDGIIPEPFPELIDNAIKESHQFCNIQCGYKIFTSVEINEINNSIKIQDEILSPAKVVTKQLKKSSSLALFICTAGSAISEHSKRISAERDPLYGYIFDVIGSVVVEKATDKLQDLLKLEMKKSNLNISDRFSPGYCEWSVSDQQKLFKLLPENFCGITLSESSLMNPIKSVSGIIGIGKELKQMGYQCNWCTDSNCIYGKIKRKKKRLSKTISNL